MGYRLIGLEGSTELKKRGINKRGKEEDSVNASASESAMVIGIDMTRMRGIGGGDKCITSKQPNII
jgi:hypothetical protein